LVRSRPVTHPMFTLHVSARPALQCPLSRDIALTVNCCQIVPSPRVLCWHGCTHVTRLVART
jgi:hypothetical protein